MADLQKIIEVIFEGTDNLSDDINNISRGLDAFTGQAEKITGPLASVADSIIAVNAAAAALGAAFLAISINEAKEFETALLDLVRVLSDEERGAIEEYKQTIMTLGEEFGISSATVAESTAQIRQSGFTIEESLQIVTASLLAQKSAGLESGEATDIVIRALRGFGLEAENATGIIDTLNGIQNNYFVSTGELGVALSELAPIAKNAGLTLEETAGILVPVIESFGSGSEAANAFKTVLLRLVSDNPAVVGALKELGVSQTDANGALRSSGDILNDILAVWPNVNASQREFLVQQLAGINQAPKLTAALNNVNQILEAQRIAANSSGSAWDEFNIKFDSLDEVLARVSVRFQNLAISIGDQLLRDTGGAALAVGNLASSFRQIVEDGGLEPLFSALRPLLQEFTDYINAIALALPEAFEGLDWERLQDAFANISDSVKGLFDGLDLTKPEDLRKAIQGLIDIGAGLVNSLAGVIEGLEPLFDAIITGADWFSKLNPEVQNFLGLIGGAGKSADIFLQFIKPLPGVIEALVAGFTALAATNIAKSFFDIAASAKDLESNLGKAGILGAIGLLGFQIGDWIEKSTDASDSVSDWAIAIRNWLTPAKDQIDVYTRENLELDSLTPKLQQNAEAKDKSADAAERLVTAEELLAEQEEGIADLVREANIERAKSTEETQKNAVATEEAAKWTVTWVDGVKTYTGVTGLKTDATKKDTQAIKEATQESENFRLKLLEIASDERIKALEVTANIKVAEIEADAQRTVAAFDSISKSVQSTGEVLTDLYAIWGDEQGLDKIQIEQWINEENRRRDELLKSQISLTNIQGDYLAAKTKKLASSDALIKVSGDGLAAELEALMWKVFDLVRIRANEEAVDFLLGIQ